MSNAKRAVIKSRELFAVGVLALMFGVLPLIHQAFDSYFLERPIVKATIEIIQDEAGDVYLLYDADAVKAAKATWIASIHSRTDTRISSRRGSGNYSAAIDDPKAWAWAAFFDQEDGTPAPTIPPFPFYICLRYVSETIDTGVTDESGPFCSDIFDRNSTE